jgi:hypothetical protein
VTTAYEYWEDNGWINAVVRHSKGRVKRAAPPDMAPTIYEYDAMGNLFRSGLDIGGNGVLDLASTDRIHETAVQYESAGGGWWRVTTNRTYPT